MGNYKNIINPFTGNLQRVLSDTYVQSLSSGGTGMFTIMPQFYDSITQGSWMTQLRNNCLFFGTWQNSTHVDQDGMDYKVFLSAGTYTLAILAMTSLLSGIIDIDIDGVNVANFDCYSPGTVANVRKTQTDIIIATSGIKTLKIYINGKNASATDYYMFLQCVSLWRTA